MRNLPMSTVQDILHRLRKGQSERAIARDLGLSRMTVRRYHDLARQHDLAQKEGLLDPNVPAPAAAAIAPVFRGASSRPVPVSTVEPYRSLVEAWRGEGLEGVAIFRRLKERHAYSGSYSSVRRFLLHLSPPDRRAVARIETPPGQQAQVDFGSLGRLLDRSSGRHRTAYAFVMTLSYSRHQYLEIVFDQTIPTWIGCHRRAFESFGGVPKEVVIDNLKAAVLEAAIEHTVLSIPYAQLARHYDVLIHPCRPRTPEHKGKVESGVHYVERNFWRGDDFSDLEDANRKARRWVREIAGVRDHGTTHEAPLYRFERDERAALLALPAEPFDLVEVRRAKVHRDGHVVVHGSYYLTPPGYIGRGLDVFIYQRTVQLYDEVTLLVTYDRSKTRGERIQRSDFLPEGARLYGKRTPDHCREEAERIGPSCRAIVEILLSERPLDRLPAAARLIGLEGGYGSGRLEAACARALFYGDPSHVRVKSILRAGLDRVPLDPMDLDPRVLDGALHREDSPSVRAGGAIPTTAGKSGPGLRARTYIHERPVQAFFPPELLGSIGACEIRPDRRQDLREEVLR